MRLSHTPLSRRQWLAHSAAAGLSLSPLLAQSESWPNKPLRLVVPFAPGGSSEIVARAVATEKAKGLGQNVFVDNKPGAAGNIAMQEVAGSTDEHTLVLGHIGTLAVNPYIFPKLPYDANKDFVPITLISKVPSLYVVHPDLPVKNLKEFVAYAKSKPGQLNYGSAGNGGSSHLVPEMFKSATGLFMVHIPYRGSAPAFTDLMAGQVQFMAESIPQAAQYHKQGKVRALAVTSRERNPALPDIPTVAEMGFKDFETSQWYGILAPAGTPPEIVKRLQEESYKALKSSAVTERFATDNAVGGGGPSSEYAAFIKNEQRIWSDIVKRAGIKPD